MNMLKILPVMIAIIVIAWSPFAYAAHMSGAEYLTTVNEQRRAASLPPVAGGVGAKAIDLVNNMSDDVFSELMKMNEARAAGGTPIWTISTTDFSLAENRGVRDSATGQIDPNKQGSATTRISSGYSTECSLKQGVNADLSGCFNVAITFFGRLILSAGSYILQLASTIFDMLIQYVVVDFRGSLQKLGLYDAIGTGWTVFRDFTNVLIIGMFVFIALCIILGIKEYGQKKLIANVLIVALLINFSLLFTRIIIDFSNFTADTIYKEVGRGDISEAFLQPMGITSTWQDGGKLIDAFTQQNGPGLALLYGIIGGFLLMTAALVLLYGAFLMAARGLLFIFLMLTAALAFATYIIPGMSEGKFGFTNWWKSLLNNAVFAPLFMVFLAISIYMVNLAAVKRGPANLGTIAADPKQIIAANGWESLLVYLLSVGLLFLSIRLSSQFAGSVSGFKLSATTLAAPVALASRFAVAPFLRWDVGGTALKQSNALGAQAQTASMRAGFATTQAAKFRDQARSAPNLAQKKEFVKLAREQDRIAKTKQSDAAHLLEKAGKEKKLADRKFNVMDTTVMKVFNKSIGNTGFGAGETGKGAKEKGYATQVEEKAKHAAEIAEKAKPGTAQKALIREAAEKEAKEKHRGDLENRRALHVAAEASYAAAKATRDTAVSEDRAAKTAAELAKSQNTTLAAAAATLAAARAAKANKVAAQNTEATALSTQIVAEQDPVRKQQLMDDLTTMRERHKRELGAFDDRVKAAIQHSELAEEEYNQTPVAVRAREAAAALPGVERELGAATTALQSASSALNKVQENIDKDTARLAKEYEATVVAGGENIAANIGHEEGGHDVAVAARAAYQKRQSNAFRVTQLLKDADLIPAAETPTTPSASTPAPTETPH